MSDARLRALSREADHGDPAARARLLLERLRAGRVAHAQLRLAAFLGDAAAASVTEAAGPSALGVGVGLTAWVSPMAAWDLATCARAAHAAASLVLPVWEASGGGPAASRTVELLAEWIVCPCAAHERAVSDARATLQTSGIVGVDPRLGAHAGRAANCIGLAAQLADGAATARGRGAPGQTAITHDALSRAAQVPAGVIDAAAAWRACPCDEHRAAINDALSSAPPVGAAGDDGVAGRGEDLVRAAVRAAVVPWVLGEGDPLAPGARA